MSTEHIPGHFASDNLASAHPRILAALLEANTGFAAAYGEDELSKRVENRIGELFERECAVFLVGTGTASNTLALSAICPPFGAIYCHEGAHMLNDECSGPEFMTGGARQVAIAGAHGKLNPDILRSHLEMAQLHGIHAVKPSVISLTNATEAGTVYTPDEVAQFAAICREHRLRLHIDGARFANAVASLGVSPAEASWKAGVDVLSFGATKNGAIAAEAIVFFDKALAGDFGYRRKRAGQLWSKHRFLAAQFDAYLHDDLWLSLARHANAMARRLADGLAAIPGVSIPSPVQANEVFPALPQEVIAGLQNDGYMFYPWPILPGMIRLVTSFATTAEEVDALVSRASLHAGRLAARNVG